MMGLLLINLILIIIELLLVNLIVLLMRFKSICCSFCVFFKIFCGRFLVIFVNSLILFCVVWVCWLLMIFWISCFGLKCVMWMLFWFVFMCEMFKMLFMWCSKSLVEVLMVVIRCNCFLLCIDFCRRVEVLRILFSGVLVLWFIIVRRLDFVFLLVLVLLWVLCSVFCEFILWVMLCIWVMKSFFLVLVLICVREIVMGKWELFVWVVWVLICFL